MSDGEVCFAVPVYVRLFFDDGWSDDMQVRAIRYADPPGTLRLALVSPVRGERVWRCLHSSVRSDDRLVGLMILEARKRAMGKAATDVLRSIADMTDRIVRGEQPR